MATEITQEHEGKVVVVRASGKLTKEDYEEFVPELERLIEQHGKIRLLFDLHDFHGWKAGALWADTKFALKHFKHIECLAIVGEKMWEHGMAIFCKPFTRAEVRYFDRGEVDLAHEWVTAGLETPAFTE